MHRVACDIPQRDEETSPGKIGNYILPTLKLELFQRSEEAIVSERTGPRMRTMIA